MSLMEPRCLVCGAPLDKGAPFQSSGRDSETCSDECWKIYSFDEDKVEPDLETIAAAQADFVAGRYQTPQEIIRELEKASE